MSQCCQFMFQGLQFAAFITIYDAAKLQLLKDNVKSKLHLTFLYLTPQSSANNDNTLPLWKKINYSAFTLSLPPPIFSLSLSLSLSLFISLSHFSLSLSPTLSLYFSSSLPLFLLHSHPLSLFTWVGHQADSSSGKPLNSQLLLQPRLLEALLWNSSSCPCFSTSPQCCKAIWFSMVASRLRVQPLQVAMQN